MARGIHIGATSFPEIRESGGFYIDKTGFIRDWWSKHYEVKLIMRPRGFGKSLAMSMVEAFFSSEYAGRSDLFKGLEIWKDEKYRKLQGSIPVISLSFERVRPASFEDAMDAVNSLLEETYSRFSFLKQSDRITDGDRNFFDRVTRGMSKATATFSLLRLCDMLVRYYGRRPIILIDDYDVPLQAAWLNGYWKEMSLFIGALLELSLKTNDNFDRGILTGVTRVPKASDFSGLNNLNVVTTTAPHYETYFGFTSQEVETAMAEFGLDDMAEVKRLYGGFTFGEVRGICNPRSITNYLKEKTFTTWWANASDNDLIAKLVREGGIYVKEDMEVLLRGEMLHADIDEEIEYGDFDGSVDAVWSFLLAMGCLRVEEHDEERWSYSFSITNGEVRRMLADIVNA